jgi:hypothetical protein
MREEMRSMTMKETVSLSKTQLENITSSSIVGNLFVTVLAVVENSPTYFNGKDINSWSSCKLKNSEKSICPVHFPFTLGLFTA